MELLSISPFLLSVLRGKMHSYDKILEFRGRVEVRYKAGKSFF
jgi:hypothetical protein